MLLLFSEVERGNISCYRGQDGEEDKSLYRKKSWDK